MNKSQEFKLKVINNKKEFAVLIIREKKVIWKCGWEGGFFKFENKEYFVKGPFFGTPNDTFAIFELVQVTDWK